MPDGLREVWGLEEPKSQAASTEQADSFRAAFQKGLDAINESLRFTATNANQDQHGEKATERDTLTSIYQSVLGKIDPTDSSVAQGAIDTALDAMRAASDKVVSFKDDVADALEGWTKKEPDFDEAVSKVEQIEEWAHEKAETLRSVVTKIQEQVNSKLYKPAVEAFEQVNDKLCEIYEEAKKQSEAKQAYDEAAQAEEELFTKADGVAHDDFFELKKAKQTYDKAKQQLDALVKDGKYEEALTKLKEVSGLATTLVDMRKGYDDYHSSLSALQADIDYVENLRDNSPPNDNWQAELGLYNSMLSNYHDAKFDQAIKDMKALQKKVADLKKRVAEHDKKAAPVATAAEAEIQKLAGGKDLSTLSTAETNQLVEKLKKLKPEKQRQLLTDLHGPSTALTDEQRLMQRAMYRAMDLDSKFKKEDQKVRDQYHNELKKDKELQDSVANWNKKNDKGEPLVDLDTKQKMIEKIISTQSKSYGIDMPKIDWYTGEEGDFGGFEADKNVISLNTFYLNNAKEMIDTVLHENTHNYQDELAKQFVAGKIKKSDPRYEQAKTFAQLHHWDAYVQHSEDAAVYKKQPEEMHAWDAGGTESTRLIRSLQAERRRGSGR